MELFFPILGLWSKNIFWKNFLISTSTQDFKIDFQNRKQIYLNRKWNYLNRKWNYFSHFHVSDKKTSFTTFFLYLPRSSKLVFKTGNEIIQTGYGINSPTSWPLIENFFYWMFLISSKGFEINFRNRKWNYPNRKWNYSSNFQASDQKTFISNHEQT